MKYFKVLFRFRTRPMYRKGRWTEKNVVFGAKDLMEALRMARAHAEKYWNRRKWNIVSCWEIEK